jgi:hypothetical protein
MNEFSVLMHLLSRQQPGPTGNLGATEEELFQALGYSGRDKEQLFQNLLTNFNEAIFPFGLHVAQNPFNFYWYISQDSQLNNFFQSSPLSNRPRLAATLCTILLFSLSTGKTITIQELQELREKKSIQEDLDDLVQLRYIQIEKQYIRLDPYLGYFLDVENFMDYMEKQLGQESIEMKEKTAPTCQDSNTPTTNSEPSPSSSSTQHE